MINNIIKAIIVIFFTLIVFLGLFILYKKIGFNVTVLWVLSFIIIKLIVNEFELFLRLLIVSLFQ